MVELEVVFIVDFKLSRPVAQFDQSGQPDGVVWLEETVIGGNGDEKDLPEKTGIWGGLSCVGGMG